MKKYTHAWIAFKAIERLQSADLTEDNRAFADYLIEWFQSYKDGVIRGAWYPDEIIKDNASSHIMNMHRLPVGANGHSPEPPEHKFPVLPSNSLLYRTGRTSPLHNRAFTIDRKYNLPERCEALSHAVIDNLRILEREPKGSPSPPPTTTPPSSSSCSATTSPTPTCPCTVTPAPATSTAGTSTPRSSRSGRRRSSASTASTATTSALCITRRVTRS